MAALQLQVFNLIDFCVGMLLGVWGFYLYTKLGSSSFTDPSIAWLEWISLILGVLLLTSSFLSFCAIANSSCRWAVIPSSYIGLLVAILALLLATLLLSLEPRLHTYLSNHGAAIGLNTAEISDVEKWCRIMAYSLFTLTAVQLLRYRVSRGYREAALRVDGEFDALLAEEDKLFQERFLSNREAREEKYDNLRSFYKNKYVGAGGASSSNKNNSRESQF